MRLLPDHHYSPAIAALLRDQGCDAVTAHERGWHDEDDESLLALCEREGRALLTNNVADFEVIVRRWQVEGRRHAGVVYTADASLPRAKATIGAYVESLRALMLEHPADRALADRTLWLRRAGASG